ncbi:hypothetical protein [Pseudopontixanthobacter vadosimaris]|uniref:hypothetical protein n=1 Tax=Pseudopontixanthobacter vadosimaris TaxID=2726450 RepID=UPI00147448C4|nr:hypothetical protein [Pseudopontixanthobacter vadosimaris]
MNSPAFPAHRPGHNPFVEITQTYRNLVILYFVFWRFLPDTVLIMRAEAGSATVLGLTLLVQFALNGFALLPFMVRRFGGLPMGWLNPLALASVLEIVKTLIKSPSHVIEPFLIWFREPVRLQHELLTFWSLEAVQWVQLKVLAMGLLGVAAYLAAFYLFRFRSKPDKPIIRTGPDVYFIAVYLVLFAAFIALIALSGGLVQHLQALAGGRFGVREGTGLLLVAVGFMPFLLVIWYLMRPQVIRNPIFLGMLLLALALQFAADGSRSSVLIPLVVFAAGWMYHNGKVPAVAGFLGILLAILALAVLGSIRQDAAQQEGSIDLTALVTFDVEGFLRQNDEEIAGRNWRSGPVAVAAEIPRERDYLYGQTYIGAVLFWVPRSIWTDKPRGVGAYANALLFLKRNSVEGFRGAAYPVGGSAEAYWNFGWLGIMVAFGLFGILHKYVAIRVMEQPDDPEMIALLLLAIIMLNSPSTDSIVPFLQMVVMLKLLFTGLRLFEPRRQAHANPPARTISR